MKAYKLFVLVLLVVLIGGCATPSGEQQQDQERIIYTGEPVEHEFPLLPYSYDALEPYIDATTMEIHYGRHHRGYYNNFTNAIRDTELENASLDFLFDNISRLNTTIRNNAGGFYNHNLFWEIMAPGGHGEPSEELSAAIDETFGSMESFQEEFNNAALTQFGSGWSWLIVKEDGQLAVTSSPNQDNPLMDIAEIQGTPILALDVWEHAYYLNYQNRRGDYINNFWFIINWEEVNRRFEEAR